MQPYQEKYIANIREMTALTVKRTAEDTSFNAYSARLMRDEAREKQMAKRNMELLRQGLLPQMDRLLSAGEEELGELQEFAGKLLCGQDEVDGSLFCQIHQALLSCARHKDDRPAMIRELYWLGIGRNATYNKMVGVEAAVAKPYMDRMRQCFEEASSYLADFEELTDTETRGYIMRSLANVALGMYQSVSDRIGLLQRALRTFQDPYYRELAPELPWDRYIRAAHKLVVSSISHSKERAMSPQDVASIMDSVHFVYHRDGGGGAPVSARQQFHCGAIDLYCGISSLGKFLAGMEKQMNTVHPWDFSNEGAYRMISLPAFYCQYLSQYPDWAARKEEYLETLYRRILKYVRSFPPEGEDGWLFLYLRQLSRTYLETANSIPYGEFLQELITRFAPQVFVHSQMVAEAAEALCGVILDKEPGFFDGIDFLRDIASPGEKRQAALDFARQCGRFHDVGKVNFLELYTRTVRLWFEDEYELAQLHTIVGGDLLKMRPSTSRCAAAAWGHHAWYDGSRGCPDAYQRPACPERRMVDVIALVDWLADVTDTGQRYTGIEKTMEEAVAEAIAMEGRQFSPLLTKRLRDKGTVELIRVAFAEGRRKAYRQMYERSGPVGGAS